MRVSVVLLSRRIACVVVATFIVGASVDGALAQRTTPLVDTSTTVRAYSERWLAQHVAARELAPSTARSYRDTLRLHILPTAVRGPRCFGDLPVRGVTRADVKALVAAKRAEEYARDTVRIDLYLVLARTGLRIGEALALQPGDVDFSERRLRVERAFTQDGRLTTPKAGYGRDVDLALQVTARLKARVNRLGSEALWFFPSTAGTPLDQRNVLRDFKRVLTKAKLPAHFSMHSLRHTFATHHLLEGGACT